MRLLRQVLALPGPLYKAQPQLQRLPLKWLLSPQLLLVPLLQPCPASPLQMRWSLAEASQQQAQNLQQA